MPQVLKLIIIPLIFFSSLNLYAESIDTFIVTPQTINNTLELDGQLEAVKTATVSAQTSGRVMKLHYDINDVVAAGSPLLELTSIEQGAKFMAAEAELSSANALNDETQLQLSRYQALFPKGAISQGQMDGVIAKAKANLQAVSAAKARMTQAQESVKYTQISAPFSGVVTQRHIQVGETVSLGQPLYTGYANDNIRAVTQVPQRFIHALRQSPAMTIELANGHEYTSEALTIFNFADPNSHSYQVRISLPAYALDLVPGNWIKARFSTGQRTGVMIPKKSLITMNELSAVYIRWGEAFVLSQIRLGNSINDEVEVLSGLSQGDEVALDAYQVLMQQKTSQ